MKLLIICVLLGAPLAHAVDPPQRPWDDLPWAIPATQAAPGVYLFNVEALYEGRKVADLRRVITIAPEKTGLKIEDIVRGLIRFSTVFDRRSMAPIAWASTLGDNVFQGALKFSPTRVTGSFVEKRGETDAAVDLTGPIFSVRQRHYASFDDGPERLDEFASDEFPIAALPLAPGYAARTQWFLATEMKAHRDRIVVFGAEMVRVPAGDFDCFRVDVTSEDEAGRKETFWIAKSSRIPVKASIVQPHENGTVVEFHSELDSPRAVGGKGEPMTESRWNELPWAVPAAESAAGEFSYAMRTKVRAEDKASYLRKVKVTKTAGGWNISDAWDQTSDPNDPLGVVVSYLLEPKTYALKSWILANRGSEVVSVQFSDRKVEISATGLEGKKVKRTRAVSGPLSIARMDFDSDGCRDFVEWAIASLPLTAGYAARMKGFSVNNTGEEQYAVNVSGLETIQVPAGSFECFKADLFTLRDPLTITTIWISMSTRTPVKVVTRHRPGDSPDIETTSELRSYTAGN